MENIERISAGNLRSFIDRSKFRRYSKYEEDRRKYDDLVKEIVYNAVYELKLTELYALENRQTLSERLLADKLKERVAGNFSSKVYSYEEETFEVFDIEGIIDAVLDLYNIVGAECRIGALSSRKKPILVSKSRLKKPFVYQSDKYLVSAGPKFVVLQPVKKNKIMPVPIKIASKSTHGTRIQLTATCLALSGTDALIDRFVDLGHGKRFMAPNYGILALYDGSEERVVFSEHRSELLQYIGEYLEAQENKKLKTAK